MSKSNTQTFLLFLSGVVSAFVWVYLSGAWGTYDTPLLETLVSFGLSIISVGYISLFLFSFILAIFFSAILNQLFGLGFVRAALTFISGCVISVLSAIFSGGYLAASMTKPYWLFVLCFLCCTFIIVRFKRV